MSEAIIGLIGVIVGSTIMVAKDFVGAFVDQKRNARYAAIRIICILNEYAQKCVDIVSDDGTSCGRPAGQTDQGEEYYEPQVEQPAHPIYPDDINWKVLDNELLYRILMLPNTARETNRYISNSAEHSGPPGYEEVFEARQEGYADLGLEALKIVAVLQDKYGLPKAPPKEWNPDWSPVDYLKQKKKEIEEKKKWYAASFEAAFSPIISTENKSE